MAAMKLHILKPSVNNMAARVFVRAAKLDFERRRCLGQDPLAGIPGEEPGPHDADDRGQGPAQGRDLGKLRHHAVSLQQA